MAEYITKKQVIEWFSCYGHDDKQIRFEDLSFDIQHMIPEDVAPVRHGKWLEWFPGDCALIMTGEEMLYRCSCCDAKYSDAEGYRYCPLCGARMDLEA